MEFIKIRYPRYIISDFAFLFDPTGLVKCFTHFSLLPNHLPLCFNINFKQQKIHEACKSKFPSIPSFRSSSLKLKHQASFCDSIFLKVLCQLFLIISPGLSTLIFFHTFLKLLFLQWFVALA